MGMTFFFCRLVPPRPTFLDDMTEEERALMGEHTEYLNARAREGIAVVFGPIAERGGGWGLLIAQAKSEAAIRDILDGDPTIKARAGFRYEITPMLSATLGAPAVAVAV